MKLKEDYPDEADPEAKAAADYGAFGPKYAAEFEAMRPKRLSEYQQRFLSLFYKCRKYAEEMKPIPIAVLTRYTKCDFAEPDVCRFIIEGVDSKFLEICGDKMRRDIDKMKKGGKS